MWKIHHLHFYTTYYVEFDKGWRAWRSAAGRTPARGRAGSGLTVKYQAFPHVFVPPFHYANPVTGQAWKK